MIGKQKKVVFAGAVGNALEWYDFTIYAFFVPLLAKQYFPNDNPFISLIATFGVFAVGFLVRPLGAVLFGYIGDHAGRKRSLILSMIMMSFPTFLIGLLPNYESIGVLAPILLMMLRIVQGLAVSGELTTATVFLIEHADSNRRGIAGSLAMAGALLGMVLSSILASTVTELFSDADLAAWGWRIPFLLGGLVGIIGLILRIRSIDPVVFEHAYAAKQKSKHNSSVRSHISTLNLRILFTGICITSIMGIGNYFLIAYFNTFLVETQHLPMRSVMVINAFAIITQFIMTMLMGRLSDFWGRKTVLGMGIIGLMVFIHPVFWLLTQHDIYYALAGEILYALAAGAISGVIPTILAELFDTYHRNMGISLSYNISLAIFGGTAPLVAISLVASTHSFFAPAWYVIACGGIALTALFSLKESYKNSFNTVAV